MHFSSPVLDLLVRLLGLLAQVTLVLGPAGSLLAALVQSRMPRLASVARALAAWGPDLPTFLERSRQVRATFGALSPTAPAPPSRVRAVLVEAVNRQCVALLEVYRQEGWAAVFGVVLTGDVTVDDKATIAALDEVDARWAPVWSAWRTLCLVEREDSGTPASGIGDPLGDEQPLAAAVRALTNSLPQPAFTRVRDLLARGGELGPRVTALRDIDPDLTLIVSARELIRRERVESGHAPDSP